MFGFGEKKAPAEGAVAAITGAASGIGRALALELASRGWEVALSDVDEEGLQETVKRVEKLGAKVSSAKVDVADKQSVHDWADEVVKQHGKVNMIVNNAGVALAATVKGSSYKDYEWIMNINLWGAVYGSKAFLPLIEKNGEPGYIVNISSVFGLFAQPSQSGYNMSKFAVRGFTESLRQELDLANSRISATSVHPGGIKTNIAKRALLGSDEDEEGRAVQGKMSKQVDSTFFRTPERAAKVIVEGALARRRRVLIGTEAWLFDVMQRTLPAGYQRLVVQSFRFMRSIGGR